MSLRSVFRVRPALRAVRVSHPVLTQASVIFARRTQSTMTLSDHKLCMIPGPVEFDNKVLDVLSTPATSHMAPSFASQFANALTLLRDVALAGPDSQPVVIAGSGTLAWDVVAANLLVPGDHAVVVNTGVFGDWFGDCLDVYGATVTHVRAPEFGAAPSLIDIEASLKQHKPRLITITHVDTSSGVLTDVRAIAELVHRVSPDTFIVVDGVCSVAAEELRQAEWGIDVVLTASQKAIGVPPGLALLVLSKRAAEFALNRPGKPAAYFASLKKWIPIMRSYEARKPAYFATPPVQLVMSLEESLKQIVAEGMDNRFEMHRQQSDRVKAALEAEGLILVPKSRELAAHSLTAVYFPNAAAGPDLVKSVVSNGIMIAGGLHPVHGTEYFRIGHMNISATRNDSNHHIDQTIDVIVSAIKAQKK